MSDPKRELLRHAVATLAYRAGKTLRGAPASFADFRAGEGTKTPGELLTHMTGLLAWALALSKGERAHVPEMLPWTEEITRFHAALEAFDAHLASDVPLQAPLERLLQGPIADALWHTGQLALLRRMAGAPIKSENYFKADIVAGRVGPDQTPPEREFD